MSIDLTPEQRRAALASGGKPLHIHDSESQRVFLLIEQGVEPALDEEYIRHGLQVAREQIRRDESSVGDIEAVIAKAKRRHSQDR
ncbi:hypothetical protein OAS39_09375 [Pirellulales bacterium]|nr:hypothetical protein [Pirellulales bacterium]